MAGLLRCARNDVLIAKLGGILVETQLSPTGKLNAIITGVGVNLTTAPQADYSTASLAEVLEAETLPTPHALAEQISGMISRWYEQCSS
jgi:biotin-(acetyl-CoA carboxylase) ligase